MNYFLIASRSSVKIILFFNLFFLVVFKINNKYIMIIKLLRKKNITDVIQSYDKKNLQIKKIIL